MGLLGLVGLVGLDMSDSGERWPRGSSGLSPAIFSYYCTFGRHHRAVALELLYLIPGSAVSLTWCYRGLEERLWCPLRDAS